MTSRLFVKARLALYLACCIAAAVPETALAQSVQQTPENAARFLALTLPEKTMDWTGPGMDGYARVALLALNTEHSHRCVLSFNIRMSNGELESHTFFMDQMQEVTQQRSQILLIATNRRRVIYVESESIAARITFAFEVLRQSCDPATGTGF